MIIINYSATRGVTDFTIFCIGYKANLQSKMAISILNENQIEHNFTFAVIPFILAQHRLIQKLHTPQKVILLSNNRDI